MNKILEQFITEQMAAKSDSDRLPLIANEAISGVRFNGFRHLNEDEETEPSSSSSSDDKMSNEELKIEALKIATSIAKLMSDVTPEDIIKISESVADFIRNHKIGTNSSKEEEKTPEESNEGTPGFDNSITEPIPAPETAVAQ